MKVRIQKASSLRTYVDYVERDVFERRSRTVRIENIDGGYGETFSLKTGHAVGSVLAIRIHPDDVPALATLPLRLAKTKPLDLNAHPLADVLREICSAREQIPADAILDPIDGALSECLNAAHDIEGDRHARLLRIARVSIAGLAVLAAEQKSSAP